MKMPDPDAPCPVTLPDGTAHAGTVMLRAVVDHPNIDVGAYTYASDFDPPDDWAQRLCPYLIPGARPRIRIGRYGQIASGVRFLAGSNHAMDGLTTYPFPIFAPEEIMTYQPDGRETIVGHDVWLGNDVKILPGAQIGNGVIVGAGSVLRGAIPDFTVVMGNPGSVVKNRFDAKTTTRLQELAWWDWPEDAVAAARPALLSGDLDALAACAP